MNSKQASHQERKQRSGTPNHKKERRHETSINWSCPHWIACELLSAMHHEMLWGVLHLKGATTGDKVQISRASEMFLVRLPLDRVARQRLFTVQVLLTIEQIVSEAHIPCFGDRAYPQWPGASGAAACAYPASGSLVAKLGATMKPCQPDRTNSLWRKALSWRRRFPPNAL
jgi:hypothetical protein